MTATPGVVNFQPMPFKPLRAGMMKHFLIKCSTVMSRDFFQASDILFCKFCCRCMSSNNYDRHAFLQTANVRHTPVSEMLKYEKMCSTESMRYTYLLFPSASINPLSSPRLWSCQLQFWWPFQDKTTEVHRELPDLPAQFPRRVKGLGNHRERPLVWSEGML